MELLKSTRELHVRISSTATLRLRGELGRLLITGTIALFLIGFIVVRLLRLFVLGFGCVVILAILRHGAGGGCRCR
jgi:hypothetical protein